MQQYLFYLFEKHTHIGEGDEIGGYIYALTSKLHVTISVTEQIINLFSISHFTDVGLLDNK